jgi:hypothetical protein
VPKAANVSSAAIAATRCMTLKRLQLDAEQAAGRRVTLSEIIRRLIDNYRSGPGTAKGARS